MWLRNIFYLPKTDRRVLLYLLLLAVLAVAAMLAVGEGEEAHYMGRETDEMVRNATPQGLPAGKSPANADGEGYYNVPAQAAERFAFDPNTADSTQLLRLGLQPWQVRNIYKYRAAGGIYRQKTDFARVYGLTQKQYRSLEPYITIGSDYAPAAHLVARNEQGRPSGQPVGVANSEAVQTATAAVRHKLLPGEHIDLNSADTTLLLRVPGIGSYFARRIVQYRDRLGGFYSSDQLREIDAFPLSAINFFTTSNKIKLLRVNSMTINELKRHPYMNYYQAKAIADYRRLQGALTSMQPLLLLPDFTAADIARLTPYVSFE